MIDFQDISKTYHPRGGPPITALSHVTFNLADKQLFCLMGPNGAGKTTLLKVIATLVLPDGGQARIAGIDVTKRPVSIRRLIGWLSPDERSFYSRLSARENLRFFGALQGLSAVESHRRAVTLAEQWKFSLPWDLSYQEFSSGMRRQLALIRALLHDPALLLLDEPTQNLDPDSAQQFREAFLQQAMGKEGRTALWVTHNPLEAVRLACPVGVLSKGRLRQLETAPVNVQDLESFYAGVVRETIPV